MLVGPFMASLLSPPECILSTCMLVGPFMASLLSPPGCILSTRMLVGPFMASLLSPPGCILSTCMLVGPFMASLLSPSDNNLPLSLCLSLCTGPRPQSSPPILRQQTSTSTCRTTGSATPLDARIVLGRFARPSQSSEFLLLPRQRSGIVCGKYSTRGAPVPSVIPPVRP